MVSRGNNKQAEINSSSLDTFPLFKVWGPQIRSIQLYRIREGNMNIGGNMGHMDFT